MASNLSKKEHHDQQVLPAMGSGHLWYIFVILSLLQWSMGYLIPYKPSSAIPETRISVSHLSKLKVFLLECKQHLIDGDTMDQLKISPPLGRKPSISGN